MDNTPFLTDEEYEELFGLSQRFSELRNVRSDAFDTIDALRKQLEMAQNQFESIQNSLNATSQQRDAKLQELMQKYGVTAGPVSVSDESPHYITVENPTA